MYVQRILRACVVGLAALAFVLVVYYITPLVYPFIFGWLLAYAINPLVKLLQRKARLPRWLAVTVSLLLFIGTIAALMTTLIAKLVREIVALSQSLESIIAYWQEQYYQFIQSDTVQDLITWVSTFYEENPDYHETINLRLTETANSLATLSSQVLASFFNTLLSFISGLPGFLTILLVALLAAFFISKDWSKHRTRLTGLFPEQIRTTTGVIWNDLKRALFGYLRAQFIMISITTVVVIIGLLILDVKYAITIGLLIGFVDLLPYFGVGAVMVPWIIYQFVYGDLFLAIGLTVLYAIVFVTRSLIEPKVLASSIGMDALYTLIAMFVGLKLFGIAGLLIGPVSLVILITLHRAHVFRDIGRYIKGKQPQ